MDQRHLPGGFLAAVGINRCRRCRRRWPCRGFLRLHDLRDVAAERAVIEWQRRQLVRQDQIRRAQGRTA